MLRHKTQDNQKQSNQLNRSHQYHFSLSEDLNSSYRPNFKKLSELRRSANDQKLSFKFSSIISSQQLHKIITNSMNTKTIACQLCQYEWEKYQMFQLCSDCRHQYCQNCLIEYVSYKVNTMEQIKCPDQFCTQKVNKNGDIFQKLPQNLKKKYKKAQLWRQTMANPHMKLCPQEECEGQVNTKQNPPTCNTCHRQFCGQCMLPRHQGTCDSFFQQNHKQWKRCPNCKMFINKTDGCNHMTCRCGHQFCFACLSNWQQSHYNCRQRVEMFYFSMDRVERPYIWIVVFTILFPIFFMLGAIAFVISFFMMIPAGVLAGVVYTVSNCYKLCCFVVILIPFGAALGAIALPFYFSAQVSIPAFVYQFRRYKITLEGLYQLVD